jgi:AcrR family transcriptional regulator
MLTLSPTESLPFVNYVENYVLSKKENSIRENRKKEILGAAKKVFINKGFDGAAMEDIIAETTLSKGGFCYYYENTVDILHDLMRDGISYRMAKMNEFMETYFGNLDKSIS